MSARRARPIALYAVVGSFLAVWGEFVLLIYPATGLSKALIISAAHVFVILLFLYWYCKQNDWEELKRLTNMAMRNWQLTILASVIAVSSTTFYMILSMILSWDEAHEPGTVGVHILEILATTVGLPLALLKLYEERSVFTNLDQVLSYAAEEIRESHSEVILFYPVPTPGCLTANKSFRKLLEAIKAVTGEGTTTVRIGTMRPQDIGQFYKAYLGRDKRQGGKYTMEDLWKDAYGPFCKLLACQRDASSRLIIQYSNEPTEFTAQYAVIDQSVYTFESFGIPYWDRANNKFTFRERSRVEVYADRVMNGVLAGEYRDKFMEQQEDREGPLATTTEAELNARHRSWRGEFVEGLMGLEKVCQEAPSNWRITDRDCWTPVAAQLPAAGLLREIVGSVRNFDVLSVRAVTLSNATNNGAELIILTCDEHHVTQNELRYRTVLSEAFTRAASYSCFTFRRLGGFVIWTVSQDATHCELLANHYVEMLGSAHG